MIVIATAMDKEYALIEKHIEKPHWYIKWLKGVLAGKEILLLKTGIGKVNAASALAEVISSFENIESVIAVGCAGAVDKDLSVGDIVVGNSFSYHDVYCGEPLTNGQVQDEPAVFPAKFSLLSNAGAYRLGMIATGDWFVTTREKAERILNFLPKTYNVCAVDMESAALAQVCYKNGIPFNSIRVISDNPLYGNQEEQYECFWETMADKAFEALTKLL